MCYGVRLADACRNKLATSIRKTNLVSIVKCLIKHVDYQIIIHMASDPKLKA